MSRTPAPLNRRSLLAGLTLAPLVASLPVRAETFPDKPIRWTVGFPAGGGTDVLARTVGAELGKRLNTQVVVENRAGAAGMIAAEAVSRAAPDAYNLLTADIAILALNPAIYSPVRYDPQKSFAAIGLMARFPLLFAASAQSGIKTMAGLQAEIRKGGFGYGSAGIGTPHHMAMELVLSTGALQAEHIPYKGDAPALQDLAGSQIQAAVLAPSLALQFARDGKIVPLAVSGEKRLAQFPDAPTLLELGLTPRPVYAWQGLVAPTGTAPERIERLSLALHQALSDPGVVRKLDELGMETIASTPDAMTAYVRQEQALWDPFIKARGISNKQ